MDDNRKSFLIDTHCHLNHPDYDSDRDAVIERAGEAGVAKIVVLGYDLASSRRAVDLARSDERIKAAIGIHPEAAGEWSNQSRSELIAMADEAGRNIAAWGEVGLDYHWESIPRPTQRQAFTEQLAIAVERDLPLSVHCRDSYSDVLDILGEFPAARAVLHCFTGSLQEAQRAVEKGFSLGVGGIATFKKSDALRRVLAQMPLDCLVLETDSPYLAPQARRGKRNEPAYLSLIADALAPSLGISAEQLAAVASANALRIFGVL